MSLLTRFSGLLASCRIVIYAILLLAVTPAQAEENGLIVMTEATPLHDLPYVDTDGKKHKLKDELGKITILHFWATWCEPCIEELPKLDAFNKKYKDQGVKVITISEDGPSKMAGIKEFLAKHKVETLTANADIGQKAFKITKTRGLPTTYFINATGQKFAVAEGSVDWEGKDTLSFVKLHLAASKQ